MITQRHISAIFVFTIIFFTKSGIAFLLSLGGISVVRTFCLYLINCFGRLTHYLFFAQINTKKKHNTTLWSLAFNFQMFAWRRMNTSFPCGLISPVVVAFFLKKNLKPWETQCKATQSLGYEASCEKRSIVTNPKP